MAAINMQRFIDADDRTNDAPHDRRDAVDDHRMEGQARGGRESSQAHHRHRPIYRDRVVMHPGDARSPAQARDHADRQESAHQQHAVGDAEQVLEFLMLPDLAGGSLPSGAQLSEVVDEPGYPCNSPERMRKIDRRPRRQKRQEQQHDHHKKTHSNNVLSSGRSATPVQKKL